jgi:hypothetical protein
VNLFCKVELFVFGIELRFVKRFLKEILRSPTSTELVDVVERQFLWDTRDVSF